MINKIGGDLKVNLDIQYTEFLAYKAIEKLSNKDLLLLLKTTDTDDTERKVLSIIKTRNFTREELNIRKISISKRIELVKSLNKENIEMIKYQAIYFTSLTYLENSIFDNSDRRYLFKLLQEAIKQENIFVIKKIFSLDKIIKIGFFNSIILMRKFNETNKIFFLSALLDTDIKIIEKKKFKKKCLEKLYGFKNNTLLKQVLYLLPKFFVFTENDLLVIYNKISNENKSVFINAMTINNIKIPNNLIKIINIENNKIFLSLLKYSDKNNIKIKKIEKHIGKGRSLCLPPEQIPYISLYLNKNLFKILKKNNNYFIKFISLLMENNKQNKIIDKYSIKNYKNLKIDLYLRISLAKYIIINKLLTNKKILKHIISLFKNKKLEYKSDEHYISIILPFLANHYNKSNYNLYKKLLKMLNKIAIESTLEAIKISNDKRFIKDLTPLLKEIEIKDLVSKTIWELK